MALIIEDGSNVSGAESFATVAELTTYATNHGLTIAATEAENEVLLRKAAAYLNSIENKYQGYRTYYDVGQSLCFPRDGIYEFDREIYGEIPQRLKDAQCQLAVDANTNDLLAAGDGREVVEKKVGPLTTKWNATGTTAPQYPSSRGGQTSQYLPPNLCMKCPPIHQLLLPFQVCPCPITTLWQIALRFLWSVSSMCP